jgi:hypothetical protein
VRAACKECPFRSTSAYFYDADAKEALDKDDEPACHMLVGHHSIFMHAPMLPEQGTECTGYHHWLNAAPGFREPRLKPNP